MKRLGQFTCLILLGGGLAAVPGISTTAASAPDDRSVVARMKSDATGAIAVTRTPATGKIGFARAARGGDLLAERGGSAVEKSRAYLDKYAGAFGATGAQLEQVGLESDPYGTTISYIQTYRGVPVFGSAIRTHIDKEGDLTAVNGFAAPGLDLSVTPKRSEQAAARRAVASVKADPPASSDGTDAAVSGLRATEAELVVYRTGSTRGADGANVLTWVVEVSNGANVRDKVFVDATTGKLLNRYSMVHDALERHIYEASYSEATKVFDEGDGDDPNALTEDQRNIYEGSGESYWFFKNAFGQDSYDGAGHVMEIVNNDPRISCPNANWNGTTTNYCNGVTSDDVVAHEWGHAYTEYSHDLIYQWQPGALNESYSDIWGETVDLINGRMDDDEGDITAKRQDGVCSVNSPLPAVAVINSPADIAKVCEAAPAQFGPQLSTAGTTGDVVLGTDDTADPGPSTTDACSPLTNAAEVAGKLALVDRGGCAFTVKVKNAQNAGATGVLVGQNNDGPPSPMGGGDATITIPSVMISKADRTRISGALGGVEPVNVTMKLQNENRESSFRWLVGEDSSAFGGAIRDMWSPTCHGDPGKVSDAEYHCTTDDGGGVHSNSGVPNHAYALTVDGGSYNGQTVTGIGVTKAAAIYYRAMTAYQTPTTNFTDHADALQAACSDLVGSRPNELSTSPDDVQRSRDRITAGDCATLDAAAAAVELRREPTQCNFQPLLDPNSPALCGEGTESKVVFSEDFEDGLAGWSADQQVVYAGASGAPWQADSTLPDNRAGQAAYGPAPDQGRCDGSAQDFSSSDSITSPVIELPKGKNAGERLSFDHYVATETGYDGGNVKFRVGNSDWQVIPASAYVFNAPTTISSAAEGNTNPLAGQDGFTGTDGGEVFGSWGQSQVDLGQLNLRGGNFQLRFDIGRDGCGGLDGWYVDDVTVAVCTDAAANRTAGRRSS